MKKSAHAFTLIELLVTISIMGILFGLGLAKYNEFNRRQILVQTANELKSNLRGAQSKALGAEKDCSSSKCGGNDGICGTNDPNERTLEGWYVSFSSNSYQLYGRCCGSGVGCQTFGSKTIDLAPRGISVSAFPSPNPILFKVLSQGTDITGTTSIRLRFSGMADEQIIRVTNAGEIY